jgi:molybdopterin synthase catalytic subunit
MSFSITTSPIEPSAESTNRGTGAVAIFEGIVRDNNDGRQVRSLEYEAMESLACKEGARILDEARQKFPIIDAQCIHRVGHLAIGDIAIRVVVKSGHRKEAFEACAYIVDEVKSRVPIWKKEHYVDGSTDWIGANFQHPNTVTP